MNSTLTPNPPAGLFSSDKIGGIGYGIALSAGILLLITTITLASYFCTHIVNTNPPNRRMRHPTWPLGDVTSTAIADIESGLDEATLMSYPKLLYSEVRSGEKGICSICLAEYKGQDQLRKLPECGHMSHVKCVDPWLQLHPTCPLCRTSPLPSPMWTPLAEVVPLARQQG